MDIVISNLHKVELFTDIFQNMKLFTENINISFEQDRMFIQTMDTSHVSIIDISIPSTWFDKYTHKEEGSVTIGINSTIFTKMLNARDKQQIVSIELNTDDSDHLYMNLTSDVPQLFDKHFEIPLLDLEQDIMTIPESDYQAEFTIKSGYFSSLINQLKNFGCNLDIECSEEHIYLAANSEESGKMQVNIDINDLDEYSIDEGEVLKVSYSLKYLNNICSYNKISPEVKIRLTRGYPMQVIYLIGGDEDAKMRMYLAPKIMDDD